MKRFSTNRQDKIYQSTTQQLQDLYLQTIANGYSCAQFIAKERFIFDNVNISFLSNSRQATLHEIGKTYFNLIFASQVVWYHILKTDQGLRLVSSEQANRLNLHQQICEQNYKGVYLHKSNLCKYWAGENTEIILLVLSQDQKFLMG